ncbi:hypothetical protein [Mycobacterium sp. GA-2829]|uniref:hypothetical protein n=1 Tax=Mycobacterium sp. GA-2829 TaxID=1772283 RepID=UPI00073FDD00|nr:hypothetical protein [Mycobacterium sp. GA-2829]KUI35053.1 hypothetical protein AU194_26310 [Mycobacterium sp. GA-2829]
MSTPDEPVFGDDAPEADVVEQRIPVDADDEDEGGLDPARVSVSRNWDANEADLIEQAIAVPLSDDDPDFDR